MKKELEQKLRDYYSVHELSHILGVSYKSLKKFFGLNKTIRAYGVNDYFVSKELLKEHFPLVIYGLPPVYIPHDNLCQSVIEDVVCAIYKFNDYVKLKTITPKQIRYFYEMKSSVIKYLIIKGFCYAAKIEIRKNEENKKEKFIVFDFNVYGKYYGFHQKYDEDIKNIFGGYCDTYPSIEFNKNKVFPYTHDEINEDEFKVENVKKEMNQLFQKIDFVYHSHIKRFSETMSLTFKLYERKK